LTCVAGRILLESFVPGIVSTDGRERNLLLRRGFDAEYDCFDFLVGLENVRRFGNLARCGIEAVASRPRCRFAFVRHNASQNTSDVLKPDQEIEAVVLGINRDEQEDFSRRPSVGYKSLGQSSREVSARTHVKGKIRNLTSYGAFIDSKMVWTV